MANGISAGFRIAAGPARRPLERPYICDAAVNSCPSISWKNDRSLVEYCEFMMPPIEWPDPKICPTSCEVSAQPKPARITLTPFLVCSAFW